MNNDRNRFTDKTDQRLTVEMFDHASNNRALALDCTDDADLAGTQAPDNRLHRMATERSGWGLFWLRWYYSDEPLRNDAANLVREAGFQAKMPDGCQLVGDDAAQS